MRFSYFSHSSGERKGSNERTNGIGILRFNVAQTFLNVVYSKPRSKQCTKLYRFSFSFFFLSFSLFIHVIIAMVHYSVRIQIVVCQPYELRQVHFHAIYTIQTHTRILNAVSRILREFVCEPLIVVNINFRLKISRMFVMFDFNSGHYTATYTHIAYYAFLPLSLTRSPTLLYANQSQHCTNRNNI